MVLEIKMTLNRNVKILMIVFAIALFFSIALFLNGFNPLLPPPEVGANENTQISGKNIGPDCSSPINGFIRSPEEVKNMERLLGYIESTVNDINLTVKGIDRKIEALPILEPAELADRG